MKNIISKICLGSLVPTMVLANSYTYTGQFNYNGRYINGEDEVAHATKYDPQDVLFGSFGAIMRNPDREFMLTGRDVATDSQGYEISGRHFEKAKYTLYYSDLTHQVSKGASVGFTTGIGTSNLGYDGTFSTTPSTWNKFDYKIERRTAGMNGNVNIGDKFYLAFALNHQEYEGIRPQGFMSLTFKMAEFPEYFKTDTNSVEADFGYKGEKSAFSLKAYISKQTPEVDRVTIKDPFAATVTEESMVAPGSNFYRVALEGTLFDLPFNSIFSFLADTTRIWNDVYLNPYRTKSTGAARVLSFTSPTFEGDISAINAKMLLKTRWTDALTTRAYARYYAKDNESTVFTTTADAASTPGSYRSDAMTNNPFDYGRENAGIAMDYLLPASTWFSGNLEYQNTRRHGRRFDVDESTDYSGTLELINRSFEKITPRTKYTYLLRESEFTAAKKNYTVNTTTGAVSGTPVTYEFLRRYDVNDKTMHQGEIGADVNLFETIKYGIADLSFMTGYRKNDYRSVVTGRTSDQRVIFDSTFTYNMRNVVKLNLYTFIEKNQEKSMLRSQDKVVATQNYAVSVGDDIVTFGADVFIPVLEEKLDVKLGYSKYKSEGEIDYVNIYDRNDTQAIKQNDDYTAESITAEVDYHWNQSLSLAVGYRHDQFDYADARINGYTQVPTTSYLYSGAYRDRSYNINEGWLGATYKF